MAKFMIVVFTGLFVFSFGSMSLAGMLDKAVEATEKANEMAKDAKAKMDHVEEKSIEAQDASQKETGDMMEQAKEVVKETVNEKIDNFGK